MGKPVLSACAVALAGILLLGDQPAFARNWPQTYHASRRQAERIEPIEPPAEPPARIASALHVVEYQPASATDSRQSLSQAALQVGEIATRNGDRDFLVIDKVHGRIILFSNGVPIFTGAALTGESLADQLPRDALAKTYAEQHDIKYHVTPAGRFTVSHGYDYQYGTTFDINEIQGSDWAIAIHTIGSWSRDARLRSPLDRDKHITEGCINVDGDTMRQLVRLLPKQGRVPLYILPMDESLIGKMF